MHLPELEKAISERLLLKVCLLSLSHLSFLLVRVSEAVYSPWNTHASSPCATSSTRRRTSTSPWTSTQLSLRLHLLIYHCYSLVLFSRYLYPYTTTVLSFSNSTLTENNSPNGGELLRTYFANKVSATAALLITVIAPLIDDSRRSSRQVTSRALSFAPRRSSPPSSTSIRTASSTSNSLSSYSCTSIHTSSSASLMRSV